MANDEFTSIRQWTVRSAGQEGDGLRVGIGDDAAVFAVAKGMEIVACCDAMIETIHFLRETMNAEDIGYKAMISNISDVAAMGGYPRYALISIGVPPHWTVDECERIYTGLYEAADKYGVRIIGGDTVATPDALHLSVTVLGEVEAGKAIRRSAAKQGELVFVTGTLGGSAAGLHMLLDARTPGRNLASGFEELRLLHQRPEAQVAAARLLIRCPGIGACNDVSDGLASELWEIAEASGVSVYIEQDRLPILPLVAAYAHTVGADPVDWVLYGGEDYQLVGTVAERDAAELQAAFHQQGLPFAVIGRVKQGPPAVWMDTEAGQKALAKAGYNHFQRS